MLIGGVFGLRRPEVRHGRGGAIRKAGDHRDALPYPSTGKMQMTRAAGQVSPRDGFAEGVAFVDGEYVPVSEARVSVLDWGFSRSDVTYDVVHVWKGRFFRLVQNPSIWST